MIQGLLSLSEKTGVKVKQIDLKETDAALVFRFVGNSLLQIEVESGNEDLEAELSRELIVAYTIAEYVRNTLNAVHATAELSLN